MMIYHRKKHTHINQYGGFPSHRATPSHHPFQWDCSLTKTIQQFWGTPMASWLPPYINQSRLTCCSDARWVKPLPCLTCPRFRKPWSEQSWGTAGNHGKSQRKPKGNSMWDSIPLWKRTEFGILWDELLLNYGSGVLLVCVESRQLALAPQAICGSVWNHSVEI